MTRSRSIALFLLATAMVTVPSMLRAACTSPAGIEGEQIYNTDYATMQFCDNANWIGMAASGAGPAEVDPKVGAMTASNWCHANAGATAIVCDAAAISLATQITGNLPVANLGSGTGASASTFWRGDGTWSAPIVSQWLNGTSGAIYYSGGNVGIGTTAPSWNLELRNDSATSAIETISGYDGGNNVYLNFWNRSASPNAAGFYVSNLAGSGVAYLRYNLSSTQWQFYAGGGTLSDLKMVVASSGNVGIGTTTPSTALQVAGTVTATTFSGSGALLTGIPVAALSATGTASATTYLRGDGAWSALNSSQWVNGTSGAIYYNAGNVGIGTASPSGTLDVSGNIRLNGYNGLSNPASDTLSIAVGRQALNAQNTVSLYNVALGYAAGLRVTSGSGLTAIGALAAEYQVASGITANTAVGYNAMVGNTDGVSSTGTGNTAVGYSALRDSAAGTNNTALGFIAAQKTTSGNHNVAVGYEAALSNVSGSFLTALGPLAAEYIVATGSTNNTAVGSTAMHGNSDGTSSTGTGNTAIGSAALYNLTSGTYNFAGGTVAGQSNTSGSYNTWLGYEAGFSNSTGNQSTIVGAIAGEYLVASGNANNTAVGYAAMAGNADGVSSTGVDNTGVGYGAMYRITSGTNNVAIGSNAGNALTTGSGNILIGIGATTAANSTSNFLNIGNAIFATGMTGSLSSPAGNVGIGTTAPTYTLHVVGTAGLSTGTAWTNASDRRLKDLHGEYQHGLSDVVQLKPIIYTYKKDNPLHLPSDKQTIGFVAQEVQKIIPEAVHERSDGYLELNVDPIHWAVVNAIKQLKAMFDALAAKVDGLNSGQTHHDGLIAAMTKRLDVQSAILKLLCDDYKLAHRDAAACNVALP